MCVIDTCNSESGDCSALLRLFGNCGWCVSCNCQTVIAVCYGWAFKVYSVEANMLRGAVQKSDDSFATGELSSISSKPQLTEESRSSQATAEASVTIGSPCVKASETNSIMR